MNINDEKSSPNLWKSYLEWVSLHPDIAMEMETCFKWISYLVTGYFRKSGSDEHSLVVSEIVFAIGDVLSFVNNCAFVQIGEFVGKDITSSDDTTSHTNKFFGDPDTLIGAIESIELLLESLAELYAIKFGTKRVKWAIITSIHFLKFILRMKSVVQKRHLISYPAIPKIDKAKLLECALPPRPLQEKKTNPKFTVMSRSGRYLRTIYGASIHNGNARAWQNDKEKYFKPDRRKTTLNRTRTLGEILFIVQPLAHLSCVAMFGRRSWKPWLISMGMELLSNASQGCKTYGWSKQERQEIWRRRLSLLMYLLRSPFYDRVTKWCIVFAFTSAQKMNIPFYSIAFETLMAYIPHYRRLYYYLWSK